MKFFNDDSVNSPTVRRHIVPHPAPALGLLKERPTTWRSRHHANRSTLQKAATMKVSLPKATCDAPKMIDGVVWTATTPPSTPTVRDQEPEYPCPIRRSAPWSAPYSIPPFDTAAADTAPEQECAADPGLRRCWSRPAAAPRGGAPSTGGRGLVKLLPPCGPGLADRHLGLADAERRHDLPRRQATFEAAIKLFADPFYATGRTTRASAGTSCSRWNAWPLGFGLAAVVGIPLGFVIGRFEVLNRMVSPRSAC